MELTLADFQIEKLLARGSFGEVYSAERIIQDISVNKILNQAFNNKRAFFNTMNVKQLGEECKTLKLNSNCNKPELVKQLMTNANIKDKLTLNQICKNFNITNHRVNNKNDMIDKLKAKLITPELAIRFRTYMGTNELPYRNCVLKRIIIENFPTIKRLYNLGKSNLKKVKKENTGEFNTSALTSDNLRSITENETNTLKFLEREINILKNLDHPHVIKLYDWFLDIGKIPMSYNNRLSRSIYLVMEQASEGDLYWYIKDKNKNGEEITLDQQRTILLQILEGLNYLHGQHIIHRDIKPENILLSSKDPIQIKIGDFGLAKLTRSTPSGVNRHTMAGTAEYAHENVRRAFNQQGAMYGKYVDYRGLGMIMYALLTCEGPQVMLDSLGVPKHFSEIKNLIDAKEVINATTGFLLKYLLNPAVKLYDYEKIKNHPFFTGLNEGFKTYAFENPSITYNQLYARRQKQNHYKKRSKAHNDEYYYNGKKKKLHFNSSCKDTSLWSDKYYCKYCGYMICLKCTPHRITTLRKVKNPTNKKKYNSESEICYACALYLGYIQPPPTL
jgi:serine/threonine protein kinase